ncbi:uncharacterized protein SCHCODRAFT_01167381 [Schizophyllum commune H4-8]|nr:uncharacterized protein SCHCODRAFT_01167381 [Schizophyllum commune H4-8]KAI5897635.1 hypothetical protein SCHCODRAFT_01167381 [Schizophyllum commune H4-8]
MPFSEYPKCSALSDSPRKDSARPPDARKEENTKQARVMHATAAEGHSVRCSIDDFWSTYVEPHGYYRLSKEDHAAIIGQLTDDRQFYGGKWKELLPRKTLKTENAHFGRLVKVVEAVVNAAATCPSGRFALDGRSSLFESRPNEETLSEVPGSSFHVDALHYLSQSTYAQNTRSGSAHSQIIESLSDNSKRIINTADVVASMEVKIKLTAATMRDDEDKTIGAAGHYLYADIRRRFHFAITIEGTTARLWCHSRSHSIVTDAFDIHEDKEQLIEWIVFVSFAKEYSLGFDPTVIRVVDGTNQWQYQFDVRHEDGVVRTYQTVAILHENCAASLYRRAMRVFKVKRVTEKGKADTFSEEDTQEYALRDYWLFDDKQTKLEFQIQSDLKDALKASTQSPEELEEVWQHFLQIVADGVVDWETFVDTVPAPPENAEAYEYVDEQNPKGRKATKPKVKGSSLRDSAGYIGPQVVAPKKPEALQLLGRKHCRTLYRHVCTDLYKINDPAVFFFALDQAVYVLTWFRRIGWMHRDISPGNIMIRSLRSAAPSEPLCKRYMVQVADLEYCREYTRISRHDPLTGTGDYMAVETQLRKHMFHGGLRVTKLAAVYFSHNFLHDLESTIWMALEFAMRHVPRELLTTKRWQDIGPILSALKTWADDIFPNSTQASAKRIDLLQDNAAQAEVKHLLRSVYGDASPMASLPGLLPDLVEVYMAVEGRLDLDDAPKDKDGNPQRMPKELFDEHAKIYDTIRASFQKVSKYYTDLEGQDAFIPFRRIDLESGKFIEKPSPSPSEGTAPKAMDVDETGQGEADQDPEAKVALGQKRKKSTKRKVQDGAAPRSKRSRTIAPAAPPAPPAAPRRSRNRTRSNDSQQPLRRSSRLAERSRSRR